MPRASRHARWEMTAGGVYVEAAPDPVLITGGVVSSWFRVGLAANLGSGQPFNLPDVLNPANPATTSTDARKPTIGMSANGLPILICNASSLLIALSAANNGATKWGIAFHSRTTSAAAFQTPFTIDTNVGASARKLLVLLNYQSSDSIYVFNAASTQSRRGGPTEQWPINTWVHSIYELNLDSGAAETARCLVRKDGIAQTSFYGNETGTPNSMPVAMPTPTGTMGLFGTAAGANSWVGEFGDILLFNNAMPGATCLLTDAAALALSNLNRPT